MVRLIDGARYFGPTESVPIEVVVRHKDSPHQRKAARLGVKVPPIRSDTVADVPPLFARIYHGLWIADCPDCRGAEFVWLDEPYFMCANCINAKVGHKWRQVVLPANRAEIERILLVRPMEINCNWDRTQSPKEMRKENRDRGLPEEMI